MFASCAFAKRYEISVQADNLTDKKYPTSLYWDQSFYAPPRNYTASLHIDF